MFKGSLGGELTQLTKVIHEGRERSLERLLAEAKQQGAVGITGVSSELRHFHGNIEFLSLASCIHSETGEPARPFSTSGDGQELYCQLDAGYQPLHFVFGNVAYSVGVGGNLIGSLKSLARGEIREFSNVFNKTRHLALERIVEQAKAAGGNAVVGIKTIVRPFQGAHEMMMLGTAARVKHIPSDYQQHTLTSDLTCEEMWNMTQMGYIPLQLVLGTAVYSLGMVGGIMAALKSFARGEINELTSLIYEAREHAIALIREQAKTIGADEVVGIKLHVHDLGNLLEFMAIGTAVKRVPGITTQSPALPPQAIIRDKETWIGDQPMVFNTTR